MLVVMCQLNVSLCQAMSAVFCCGALADQASLSSDGHYKWLDNILDSQDREVGAYVYMGRAARISQFIFLPTN